MKKAFAIMLLTIHLFNIGGYALLYQYFINRSDVQMVNQIYDNKIDNKKFVEIKIPQHLPIMQDWDQYQEVVGQIKVKDAYYNYVRMRMTRDTMYLICVANTNKTRLVNADIKTTKEINDVPVSKKGQEPWAKKANTYSEYNLAVFSYHYSAFGTLLKTCERIGYTKFNDPYIESPGKPPNSVC